MNDDLRHLQGLGDALAPPPGGPPPSLRRRILATAQRSIATPAPVGTRAPRRHRLRLAWGVPALAGALATVTAAVLALTASPTAPGPRISSPPPGVVASGETSTEVLRLAADHAALAPPKPARPDQFVYTESVVVYRDIDVATGAATLRGPLLVREWSSVDGRHPGLARSRPLADPTAPWSTDPTPTGATFVSVLPTSGDAMYAVLYTRGGTPLDPGMIGGGPDDLAFQRAAAALFLGQASPGVQAAVYDALARIPGVTVRLGVTDVAGRPGVALSRGGPDGSIELIFDPTTYQYLGVEQAFTPKQVRSPTHDTHQIVPTLAQQALLTAAIVDHPGDLP